MNLYSACYSDWHPFDKFYPTAKKIVCREGNESLEHPGVLILWGGGDIHPSLYNRENLASNVGKQLSNRDQIEAALLAKAIDIGMPVIGVCRGAQMCCAAAGGILIQDVNNHHVDHRIKTTTGLSLITSSLHHQMMYPWKVPYELMAWSAYPLSTEFVGLTTQEAESIPCMPNTDSFYEPEVVWFPSILSIAIQGHPEYMKSTEPFNQYVKELVDGYIIPSVVEHT